MEHTGSTMVHSTLQLQIRNQIGSQQGPLGQPLQAGIEAYSYHIPLTIPSDSGLTGEIV